MTNEEIKLPWKAEMASWGGDEYWTILDSSGAVVCMEPTDFHCYESGSFISPEGQEVHRDHIIKCVNDFDLNSKGKTL